MPQKYTHDIIVIGAGSGGLNCAVFMQRTGFKVLLIDKKANTFGGDCLNYGCIPSKSLLHVASLIHAGEESARFQALQSGDVSITKVMDYVRQRQDVIRAHENPEYFKQLGMDIAIGDATFSGKHKVVVDKTHFSAKHIVIATGSRPRETTVPGIDTIPHFTNETIFDIQFLPKNFVFIGGGPINIELGQAFSRLGSKVTILQADDRILNKEDAEVASLMQTVLEQEGMVIHTGVTVQSVENGLVVISNPDGSTDKIPADAVFVGIGRVPNVDNLKLETAGISTNDRGAIVLDKYLRTSNKVVSAVGDATDMYMFTHSAEIQASVVLNNFFAPFMKRYSSARMAWVTFSDPEIATFGASKQQLDSDHTRYDEVRVNLVEDDRAITEDATQGFLKLYVSKKGRLLGGTMAGRRAGEIVSELILMMHIGLKLKSVLGKPFPYPIGSRVIQAASRQYSGKRLQSPIVRRLLRYIYH